MRYKELKSNTTIQGRKMAGARSLWRANGMKKEQMGKPIIGIANSFTQFVPGHVHLKEVGQQIKDKIEKLGFFAAEFNTIAIDDGIAMGHQGMLYSLPSRELIADSVEYMANAHCVDALICISNCDKITPGMLMASMRLNIPTLFVSGGPMEAGTMQGKDIDLVDVMVEAANSEKSEEEIAQMEESGCPTCGSCAGMFTANSMNCLTEALGLSLVGNGTLVATHENRKMLFDLAAEKIVNLANRYYAEQDNTVLPRSIANRDAFLNAMTTDIAMGGSTNTVLHLLAIAQEGDIDFTLADIDRLSRNTPCICKIAPSSHYHMQDLHRAGGIMGIMSELNKKGLIDTSRKRTDECSLATALEKYNIGNNESTEKDIFLAAPGQVGRNNKGFSQNRLYTSFDHNRETGCIRDVEHAYYQDGGLAVLFGNIAPKGAIVKTAGVSEELHTFKGTAIVFESQEEACKGILDGTVKAGHVVIIRYEGPKGGPGMQEMLYPTSYLKSMKLDKECALITDGRFSGGTSGLSIGHVSPEAASEGPLAWVENGDCITINIPNRSLDVELTEDQLNDRKKRQELRNEKAYTPIHRDRKVSKALKMYAHFVESAHKGAIRKM